LMEKLAAAYHQRRPLVSIEVDGGGSRLGWILAHDNEVDLGMISFPAGDVPAQLRAVTIARDGIAIVVHPNNPLPNLTSLELREIYAGRVSDWRELGSDLASGEIKLVSREDGSGTRVSFEARIMGPLPVSPTAVVMPNSRAVLDFVAVQPNAIGYVSAALVTDSVRIVPVEGIEPGPATVSTGEYPLTRELQVLVQTNPRPEVDAFVAFALSPTGQSIVAESYGRVR
jgi:phosphate transport system substrate-binding protein